MITLMSPLHLAALLHPRRVALVTEDARLTYLQYYQQAFRLAQILMADYDLHSGHTVGVLCRNHLLSALLLPALSRLGIHIRMFNTDMPSVQIASLLNDRYRLLIFDEEVRSRCLPSILPCPAVSAEQLSLQLRAFGSSSLPRLPFLPGVASISVFSSGTSGSCTAASRSTRVLQYLSPFYALLRHVGIYRHESVLIALPLYHGFGLAVLIVSIVLGKKLCLLRHFDSHAVLQMVSRERIEVLPVVPAMLSRLWQLPDAAQSLCSVRCILSGGDYLPQSLIRHTQQQLGPILYNLYGTTEAGFFVLAKPSDLAQSDREGLLGKPVFGVRCDVRETDAQGVGTLWVCSGWAMSDRQHRWQNTGDLVSRDASGYFYYHGRADRVVVCGGENVSLDHVEHILCSHPVISNAHVFPVAHPDFGQVLHAQVTMSDSSGSIEDLRPWLSTRLSRAEMPKHFF